MMNESDQLLAALVAWADDAGVVRFDGPWRDARLHLSAAAGSAESVGAELTDDEWNELRYDLGALGVVSSRDSDSQRADWRRGIGKRALAYIEYLRARPSAAGRAEPDRNSHEYYDHHAAPAAARAEPAMEPVACTHGPCEAAQTGKCDWPACSIAPSPASPAGRADGGERDPTDDAPGTGILDDCAPRKRAPPPDDLVRRHERLQRFAREHMHGGCKMLSEGDACTCPLCDADTLRSAIEARDRTIAERDAKIAMLKGVDCHGYIVGEGSAMHLEPACVRFKREAEQAEADAARKEKALAEAERDAARYRWLRPRMFSVDWQYGDPPCSVITFSWPDEAPVGMDLDHAIDAAMSKS